jgi:hypothetical protein
MRLTRSPCCACATSGHAAAPSPAMNSRRRIRDLPALFGSSLSRGRLQGNGGSPSSMESPSSTWKRGSLR